MLERETRDFVRATQGVQAATGWTVSEAEREAVRILGRGLPTLLDREVRDFVRATLGVQAATGWPMNQAKDEAARLLGVGAPNQSEFNLSLSPAPIRRRRGRKLTDGLSKRDAVAAVAVYFQSTGAGPEQSIVEAKRWLNIALSRRVAKNAVSTYKGNTAPDQFKPQALWAYAKFRQDTTLALPDVLLPARRKRRTKSHLG